MIRLFVILSILLFSQNSFAALTSDSAWEVRTTGDNTNGSCYDTGGSGTDYSQQDAAQLSLTDLTTSGAGATTITSVTGGFTSQMVDNCIRIASGTNFTAGYYEIVTFTDTNNVVLDRTPTAGGAGSVGAGKVGGAAADPEQVTSGVVAGNTVWIKAGTYSVTVNTDTAGSGGSAIQWIGYNASRGDWPRGTDRPLIDCADTRGNGVVSDVDFQQWYNLRVQDCTGTGFALSNDNAFVWNVKSSSNTGAGFSQVDGSTAYAFFEIESASNGVEGVDGNIASTVGGSYYSSYIHDNSGEGISAGAGSIFFNTIIAQNGGDGVSDVSRALNSVSWGNTGVNSDGWDEIDSQLETLINTVGSENGRMGFVGTANVENIFDYNQYEGNSSAGLSNQTAGDNDVTADAAFTDGANDDFTVGSTSSLINAGSPGSNMAIGLAGTYKNNIGVDQDDTVTAGGGSTDLLGVIQ